MMSISGKNIVFYWAFKAAVVLALLMVLTLNTEASFAESRDVDSHRSEELQIADLNAQVLSVKQAQTQITVGATEPQTRIVKLSVSYPLGGPPGAAYPLIVFSHGHALDHVSYYKLTDHWVAQGYVVVAPLHLDSGGDLAVVAKISEKLGSDWIGASRLIELNSVIENIDEIMSSLEDFNGRVTTEQVIAAGHSFGALSSQQLAGAAFQRQGNSIYPIPDTLVNESVVAVIAISPPGLIPELLTKATWADFNTPQLVVTGPNDFFPHIWPNYEDHFVSYLTAKADDNYLLVLDAMDHYLGNLIGRLQRPGPPQELALQNLSEISSIFIEQYINNQPPKQISSDQRSRISERSGVLRFEHR